MGEIAVSFAIEILRGCYFAHTPVVFVFADDAGGLGMLALYTTLPVCCHLQLVRVCCVLGM